MTFSLLSACPSWKTDSRAASDLDAMPLMWLNCKGTPPRVGGCDRDGITHWGRVTHICVGNLTNIGSDNDLSPGRCQAIIRTNARILLIGPLGTNFSEIQIEIPTFSFKKMRLNMSSATWRPFCLGLKVLRWRLTAHRSGAISRILATLLLVCDLNRTPNCYGKTWRFLCPFFRNLHLRENLARDCFTSTVSTVTNSVQNIFTHLRYCDK